jgi:hypothetical protein
MVKRRVNYNPHKMTDAGIFAKSRAASGVRPKSKTYAPRVVQRLAVLRGVKIPYRVGTKQYRLAQELKLISNSKVSASASKQDVYAVLASLRRRSSLRYLKKADVFTGAELSVVFNTLVKKGVIVYNPTGIKK